ncbi:hypothetical protein [Azospirillum thermophilum]|nr:hypothetical protein [Azospirillum thermophilum]
MTLAYIALTASSQVFLNHVGGAIPPAVGLFYMALAASLVFNLAERRNAARNHRSLLRHWRSYAALSVAFVLNWLFSYHSVTHAPADFFIAVFFLSSALCSCVAKRRRAKAAVTAAAILAMRQLSGVGFELLATSMLAGVAMYVYYVSSLRFSTDSGLGPVAVVSMRCYALLAGCAGFLAATGTVHELAVAPPVAVDLLILVIANMVLPSFLSQTCLQLVGVTAFTFMNSLIPVLTFGLQSVVADRWQGGMLLAVMIATAALNYDDLLRHLRARARGDAA